MTFIPWKSWQKKTINEIYLLLSLFFVYHGSLEQQNSRIYIAKASSDLESDRVSSKTNTVPSFALLSVDLWLYGRQAWSRILKIEFRIIARLIEKIF